MREAGAIGSPVPAVSVRGLRKRFGYHDVLRGIDLDVPRGGCFAIYGHNGAGKSTFLRIVAGQWTYAEGTVRVLGLDMRRESLEARARLGVVFHESFLRQEFTLDENLRFSCDLHGLRFRDVAARAEGLLDRFGLAPRRHDRVGTFSQGMTRRASIVRSLLHGPELWLLDEPFSGLDPAGQELLKGMIRDFAACGTVLLVTHDLALGAELAGVSACFADGALAAGGAGASPCESPGREGAP